jgi:ceramide glucosyltransferase
MAAWISVALFVGAAIGMTLYLIQLISTRRHLAESAPQPRQYPGISILKPLCGLDDDLWQNLERFASLSYPRYELLLGLRSASDSAYPIARRAAARWPGRVRVVLQEGEPGMNPKVNQLITLTNAARYDILVVSDSNVQVDVDYLEEIAAHLENDQVGLVTHAVVGVGESRLGSLMDNLHLAASIGSGMIGAKRVAKQDVVVGKSMALRREDLAALGGFESVADVLAEDFILGRMVGRELNKQVAMAHRPVWNVSRNRGVSDFFGRYKRWSVMHRQAVGPYVYSAQVLLNPVLLALLGAMSAPSMGRLAALGGICAGKIAYDCAVLRVLRGGRVALLAVFASPAKDLLIGAAWVHGFLNRRVEWRSNRLRVLAGTRLERPDDAQVAVPVQRAA